MTLLKFVQLPRDSSNEINKFTHNNHNTKHRHATAINDNDAENDKRNSTDMKKMTIIVKY